MHIKLSKRSVEVRAAHWGERSLMLELGFLPAFKVHAIMGIYLKHAIGFWTPNESKTTRRVYNTSSRACLFRIAWKQFCSLDDFFK